MQNLGCVIDLELQKSQISDMPDCDGKPEHFQKGNYQVEIIKLQCSCLYCAHFWASSQGIFTLLKCNIHIYKLM